jgi:hypothetical protein
MTDKPDNLTRQQIAARDRSLPGKVTGRLRRAIQSMVWEAARRSDAALAAGMTDHSLRAALKKPHVMGALLHEMQVLRSSERPRNISALVQVRDNSENDMARVSAAKTLEALSEESTDRARGTVTLPGLIIEIHNPSPADRAQDRLVDVTPPARQIEHEPTPAERSSSWISIEEVRGEQIPPRDDSFTEVEPDVPPPAERPETLAELQDRLAAYSARHAAPPGMLGCKKQPWEDGYEAEQRSQRRQSPRARRLRAIRED